MDTGLILDGIKGKMPRGKLGKATLAELQSRLDSLNDSQRDDALLKIQGANLKNVIIIDICNFFFGQLGVGRFMIGDKAIGIARLTFTIITVILGALSDGSSKESIIAVIDSFCLFISFIWWLVDLFLVEKKVRMQNLRKVLLAIESVKGK